MRIPRLNALRGGSASAYTLAEVMVAVLIIGTMVVCLYGGFSSGFAIMQMAREDLRATQILMQKMEAVRLCTWRQVTNASISFSERYDPLGASSNSGGALYSGVLQVGPATAIPSVAYSSNVRLITGRIYWTNFSGGKQIVRSREMQTLAARYGMQSYLWGAVK